MASPFNPYQAPVDEARASVGVGDFEIGQAVSDGFERTKLYWSTAIGVLLLGGLLILLSTVTVIGYFLVVPVFGWGMTKFFLNMQDQRQPQLNDLFAGFSNYGTALGRMLLVGVTYIGMALLSESGVFIGQYLKSTPIVIAGYAIYLVFFVFVLARFYFAFFFLVDRDLKAMDALGASWRATEGKGLKMVGLALVAGLIGSLGVLGLCVGVFFTIPMSYVMYASAYRQVVGYEPPPAVASWG
jgi:hypothetical protein